VPLDNDLDRLLADARPRAPSGFDERVMARIAASQKRPSALLYGATGATLVAVAAVAVLFLTRSRPGAVVAPPSATSPLGAEAAIEGMPIGTPISLTVDGKTIELCPGSSARMVDGKVQLDFGKARLRGPDVAINTAVGRVTTLRPDTEAELELRGRQEMEKPNKTGLSAIAAGSLMLTVFAAQGAVRVDAPYGQTLLGPGDRTLAQSGHSPVTLRASKPAAAAAPAPKPQPKAVAVKAPTEGHDLGELDKETIRQGIRSVMPGIKTCYEQGLERDPQLRGKVVVKFIIRTKDGKGRVDEAEIDPEAGDFNAPLVEQCILNTLATVEFPAPQGNGEVRVSYPFMLEFSGDKQAPVRTTKPTAPKSAPKK
jgi:hypothetical protein